MKYYEGMDDYTPENHRAWKRNADYQRPWSAPSRIESDPEGWSWLILVVVLLPFLAFS